MSGYLRITRCHVNEIGWIKMWLIVQMLGHTWRVRNASDNSFTSSYSCLKIDCRICINEGVREGERERQVRNFEVDSYARGNHYLGVSVYAEHDAQVFFL